MVPIGEQRETLPLGPAEFIPAAALVVLLAGLTLAAGPATAYMDDTAMQLFAPAAYLEAVLGPGRDCGDADQAFSPSRPVGTAGCPLADASPTLQLRTVPSRPVLRDLHSELHTPPLAGTAPHAGES